MLTTFSAVMCWPQATSAYIGRHVSQNDWNLIQFVMHQHDGDGHMPTAPFLAGRVPNVQFGCSMDCYYSWKLALIQPWRQLSDLLGGRDSFQAAYHTIERGVYDQ
jgi:hypothetical protein